MEPSPSSPPPSLAFSNMNFKKTLSIVALAWTLSSVPAQAVSSPTYIEIFQDFEKGVETQSGSLQDGATPIVLPTYVSPEDTNGGADSLREALNTLMDFVKLLVVPVMLLIIFVMAIRMVSAGRENEEVATKAKTYATYALEGIIAIMIADTVVNVFFGPEGEIFMQGEAGVQQFGRQADRLFQGFYNFVEAVIGGVAVFTLITAGFRYVAGSYSDEQIASAKNQITWSLVGLVIVGLSELVVKGILFPNQGTSLGLEEANTLFADITNFIGGLMGTLAFIAMLYAGGLYITARDNEDNVSKAKTILTGAAIGIIIALMAFALTNTIVALDATR